MITRSRRNQTEALWDFVGVLTIRRLIPNWLRGYRLAKAWSDSLAGLTLAAYAIPVSMAYASLAGLPPHHGIYCYFVGGPAYALWGTSRQVAIGPTSAIAMLVGTTVAAMAGGDTSRAVAIAALVALLVAVLCGGAWALRLSGLVNFISETILTGFKAGAAATIALTQLPKLFGVPGGGDGFFERLYILAGQLADTNLVVLSLGLVALGILVAGEVWWPGKPVALGVVAAATALVGWAQLSQYGVPTVGLLPAGLPAVGWPSLHTRDVDGVVSLAAACFLLAYVEGVSAAKTLAKKHGYAIDPRQELLGLGSANLAAAVWQGFPVAGGLSQSAVNDKAGAETPLALVVASAAIGVCLVFLTGLLENLPSVVLAAIVLVAVRGLIDGAAFRRLWAISRRECAVALVALAGVLLLGVLRGVLVAVVVSLLMLLAGAATPHVARLGRIPGTRRYSDMDRHPENLPVPGLLLVRIEASILYFNADHVRGAIGRLVEPASGLRQVVCDLSNAPWIDVAGAEMLRELHQELAGRGIQLRVVEAHAQVRDLLRAVAVHAQLGGVGRQTSLDMAVSEFEANSAEATAANDIAASPTQTHD